MANIVRHHSNPRLSSAVTHNGVGRGKPDGLHLGADLRQHPCSLFCRAHHVRVGAGGVQDAIDADTNLAYPFADADQVVRHRLMRGRRIVWIDPGERTQHGGRVGGAACHGADMVHGLGQREHGLAFRTQKYR